MANENEHNVETGGEYTPHIVFAGETDSKRITSVEIVEQDGERLIVTKTLQPLPDDFADDFEGTEGKMPGGTWKILPNVDGEPTALFKTQGFTFEYAALLGAAFLPTIQNHAPETWHKVTRYDWDKQAGDFVHTRMGDLPGMTDPDDIEEEETQIEPGEDTPHPAEAWTQAGDGQATGSPYVTVACGRIDGYERLGAALVDAACIDAGSTVIGVGTDYGAADAYLEGLRRSLPMEGGGPAYSCVLIPGGMEAPTVGGDPALWALFACPVNETATAEVSA